ncbi:UvrD-helicase domain-containing protein [Persicirhabdus sediminis]|uniref:DNA 3'-5' helicase n=1 Tax=Persicirhabdus sediminis TaxID=454144 RepID=A0A8J7MCL3_9BACT|nr:UvrD-helicase domain-containing protein [Persicirhabdus sediminis]MBK1790012.1 UvrD-helicase domain-containing protein [Persicirhabdus sediminis]
MNAFDPIHTPIDKGLTLLEAGAGTGKTYSLVRLVVRQLVELDIPIENTLVVTFTRAATAEIAGRLQELVRECYSQLKNPEQFEDFNDLVSEWHNRGELFCAHAQRQLLVALCTFDSSSVFTIDGFFQRILREFAFESNALFTSELMPDESALIDTALRDYWRQFVYVKSADELAIFDAAVDFEAARSFFNETKQNASAELDPAYSQSPNQFIKLWQKFISSLEKNIEAVEAFISSPPAAYKKTGKPFRKFKGELKHIGCLQELLADRGKPQFDHETIACLSASYLQDSARFGKGKSYALEENALWSFFQLAEEVSRVSEAAYRSAFLGHIHREVSKSLYQLKSSLNVQGYGDITARLYKILHDDSPASEAIKQAIRQRYQAALIDEFQDTSPEQCQIFLRLFHHSAGYLHIIGDPKQSIYKFRGADVFAYLAAKEKADHEYSLSTNYRSTPAMIHAINEFFTQSDDPFLTNKKIDFIPASWPDQDGSTPPANESYPALQLKVIDGSAQKSDASEQLILDDLCQEIRALLDKTWGDINPKHDHSNERITAPEIAVLVRSAKQGQMVANALSQLNIPATLNTRTTLLESNEAKELMFIINAVLNPRDHGLSRLALLTPTLGCGKLFPDSLDEEDTDALNEWIAVFLNLKQTWLDSGFMPMLLKLSQKFSIHKQLLSLDNGERRLTNFLHLAEVLDEKSRVDHLSPEGLTGWLNEAIQGQLRDIDSETLELRISSDTAALQILTQHTSKGLEYPIVFIPFPCFSKVADKMLSKVYHDPVSQLAKFAPYGKSDEEIQQLRLNEDLADAARLIYVSLTRAEQLCYFYYRSANSREGNGKSHAAFQILEQPELTDFQSLEDNSHATIKHQLLELSDETIEIEKWSEVQPQESQAEDLCTRSAKSIEVKQSHRSTSFTGITRRLHSQTRDYDYQDANTNTGLLKQAAFWNHFTPGASLGLVFHEILEECNFQQLDDIRPLIANKLDKYQPWPEAMTGNELEELIEAIVDYLKKLMNHQLAEDLQLAQISHSQRLNEADFLLSGKNFSLRQLAGVLATDSPQGMPNYYPESLQKINQRELDGYLEGIIDLIFEHNGRYHILDWKTNQLADSDPATIADAMAKSHYYLQYHLYALALDRFLQSKLGDSYDPANYLGDIYYVFLRATHPDDAGSGVFRDRITPARLKSLREALN